jgi:hypothetical protein
VWSRALEGRTLTFRLIGINNQNFLMEDLETGSWWQQVSGEAVLGPLKGRRLKQVLHDEVTFGLWQRENPGGRVLALDPRQSQIGRDWEGRVARNPVVTSHPNDPLDPRTLIVGIALDGVARAYPVDPLKRTRVLLDELNGVSIAVVTGADGRSVRAFNRRVDGQVLELVDRVGSSPARYVDVQTGSEWDVSGQAVSGPLNGRRLARIPLISDYWFDWRTYHPDTTVYREWQPPDSR